MIFKEKKKIKRKDWKYRKFDKNKRWKDYKKKIGEEDILRLVNMIEKKEWKDEKMEKIKNGNS